MWYFLIQKFNTVSNMQVLNKQHDGSNCDDRATMEEDYYKTKNKKQNQATEHFYCENTAFLLSYCCAWFKFKYEQKCKLVCQDFQQYVGACLLDL